MGTVAILTSSIICVVCIIAAISIVVFFHIRENKMRKELELKRDELSSCKEKKEKKDNKTRKELELKKDELSSCEEKKGKLEKEEKKWKKQDGRNCIGLSYSTQDTEVQKIMKATQKAITVLQSEGCSLMKNTKVDKQLKSMLETSEKISCLKTKKETMPSIAKLMDDGKTKMSKRSMDNLNTLLGLVVDAGCVNGFLDVNKFVNLMQRVRTSLCKDL